jgi:serine/threonine protein kinase
MRRIADYTFVELLGEGNHGRFYKALPPERLGLDAEYVAVKVLDKNASADDYKRFANELKLFAAIKSPFLVTLYDAGHQAGTLYYAMEYFPMGSLERPATAPNRAEVLRAVACAARGAHAMHEVGVAHRDIKPANILLHASGAKLSDLGLAQILNPGQTVTGTGPLGTIEYLEPSVIRGERASRSSDIWALGVTLHKALTGKSVFGELPTNDILAALKHLLQARPMIDPTLPKDIRALIETCLAESPTDRPPTAAALADRLDAIRERL